MLYPKIKDTITISSWREGYILRSKSKNSGQVFINSEENRLVTMMNGQNSIDDLERSANSQDPLVITKLLRSLWNRDMLEECDEVQNLLFPEQKQFVAQQKRRRNFIGTDVVQMPLEIPLALRNDLLHHTGVVFLAATLLLSTVYLFFADHLTLPDSPFNFRNDWVTGSLFSYFLRFLVGVIILVPWIQSVALNVGGRMAQER